MEEAPFLKRGTSQMSCSMFSFPTFLSLKTALDIIGLPSWHWVKVRYGDYTKLACRLIHFPSGKDVHLDSGAAVLLLLCPAGESETSEV